MKRNTNLWLTVDPGTLRHQAQIQARATSTPDAFGQATPIWGTVRTGWAGIASITQREVYQSGEMTSQVTHIITMRWNAIPVEAGMRILIGAQTYLIQAAVNVDLRNIALKLYVLELNGIV